MSMKSNVGLIDRMLRLGVSMILFYLAFYFPATASDVVTSYTLVAMGAINAIVALIGICPVYLMIGVKTNRAS